MEHGFAFISGRVTHCWLTGPGHHNIHHVLVEQSPRATRHLSDSTTSSHITHSALEGGEIQGNNIEYTAWTM